MSRLVGLDDLLTKERADRHAAHRKALGQGSPRTRRAYVFYERIVRFAGNTDSDLGVVLAVVFAHEIAHTLMARYNHSPEGLMRANFHGRIASVPDFGQRQATLIRAALTSAR